MIECLRSVKHTLQQFELELHTHPEYYEFETSEVDGETKWDMKDFTALKSIMVDESCLIPYWQSCDGTSGRLFTNFFPANTEEIEVHNTWKDIDVDLQTLLDLAHIGEFPELRFIEIWLHWNRPKPKVKQYEKAEGRVKLFVHELTTGCYHCDEVQNGDWEGHPFVASGRPDGY